MGTNSGDFGLNGNFPQNLITLAPSSVSALHFQLDSQIPANRRSLEVLKME